MENDSMSVKEQINWLVNRIDDSNEKLLKQLLRVVNDAVINGRIE